MLFSSFVTVTSNDEKTLLSTFDVAFMTAFPFPIAVTVPLLSTDATPSFDDSQLTFLFETPSGNIVYSMLYFSSLLSVRPFCEISSEKTIDCGRTKLPPVEFFVNALILTFALLLSKQYSYLYFYELSNKHL